MSTMNNINNSFKGYGKVDPAEELAFRRKTRRRVAVLAVSSVVFVAVIVGAVASIVVNSKSDSPPSNQRPPATSLKAVCSVTQYPDACFSSIAPIRENSTDPQAIFVSSLRVLQDSLNKVKQLPAKLSQGLNDSFLVGALADCGTLLDDAYDYLNDTVSAVDDKTVLSSSVINDAKTWLSSVITNQQTCIDSLTDATSGNQSPILQQVKETMQNSTEFASNSLAIMTKILGLLSTYDGEKARRKLLSNEDGVPLWVSRSLLQRRNPKADFTVAQDGTGNFTTIEAAFEKIPQKSNRRIVIHIKAGNYTENIVLGKSAWNVMLFGDGINRTIISGRRSVGDNFTTFASATFAAVGKSFVARDISFENTAGPQKHQAVAFRSGSDLSVYIRCGFDAFQDTLYAHSNRQFYSNCQISGTVDFIFGNAAAVLKGCRIKPREPLVGQFNTITAQGKMDPNQNTGISIMNSNISAFGALTAKTYLGRPWKNYSTTVVMQTAIGPLVSPDGWSPWIPGVTPPNTIFYGEYQNTGPGSNVSKRVKWAGVYPAMNRNQARKYSVNSLIQGNMWIPAVTKGL